MSNIEREELGDKLWDVLATPMTNGKGERTSMQKSAKLIEMERKEILQLIDIYVDRQKREARMEGFHEGRLAANNPNYKYGYEPQQKEGDK